MQLELGEALIGDARTSTISAGEQLFESSFLKEDVNGRSKDD
jgi:hypothetical protein